MRAMTWVAATVAVAVAAMACGRGGAGAGKSPPSVAQGSGGDAQGGAGPAPGIPCDGTVTLVVRGVNPDRFTTFNLDLTSVTLTSGGAALTPDWSAAGRTLSLAGPETPELAALKRVAGPVDVTVTLGNVLVCTVAGCSTVDTCTAPITFRYDVNQADPNGCHVFLQLDLTSSVQPVAGGQTFLPSFSVKYW
ncbi:MAG TPA: hypothetical protein VF841_05205 [Anaeromyxobacter sp.]